MELLEAARDLAALVYRVWAIEQSQKWDARIATCKARGATGQVSRSLGSLPCELCVMGDLLWRRFDDWRSLHNAYVTQRHTNPCGCKEME